MKPEIGTKVYCIYGEGILVDEVAFIGKESFIISSFGRATYEDSWEWYYKDYEKRWFIDLEGAKIELLSQYKAKGNFKIEQTYKDWYSLIDIDE